MSKAKQNPPNTGQTPVVWFAGRMNRFRGQETITASPGAVNATAEGDFVDRAYEYGAIAVSSIKSFIRWSLVCEEAAQKEQTQLEKIIGNLGHDPTAPSDLHTVTETVMFDSATIMATLIATFCIFYFIDFFLQIFGGFSVLGAADISPSLASIQPVIPTRTKKRKKSGSSVSRETTVSTQPSSLLSRPESTQGSSTSTPTVPMKEILTKSFRSSISKETVTPSFFTPQSKLGEQQSMLSTETRVSDEMIRNEYGKEKTTGSKSARSSGETIPSKPASKRSPGRKLAGRSPAKIDNVNGTDNIDLRSKEVDTCGECGLDGDFHTYSSIKSGRGLVINEDKQTQTTDDDFCFENDQTGTDTGSSVEGRCHNKFLKLDYKRRIRDFVYDEEHGLPYADDLSGDEFDIFEHEKAQAYLKYEAKLDALRTEFSIDDVTDPDKLLDEWENVEDAPAVFPTRNPLLMLPREDDLESLYSKAEDIFKRMNIQGKDKGHVEVLREMGARIKAHGAEKEEGISGLPIASKEVRQSGEKEVLDLSPHYDTATPLISPKANSALLSSPEYHEEGGPGGRLSTIVEYSIGYEGLDEEPFPRHGLQKVSIIETDWEEPRSLELSSNMDYERHESFLARGDDVILSEYGCRTTKSISVFSIRQSVELRRFHHVLFTYPDPNAHKVLLTGSFFGWKMSLPMQREGKVFRLSITLPAGVHQYRFQVYRHAGRVETAAPYIIHE